MSVDEKPPDSGFQPEPTSVLMFGSLLTIVVARGAAFGEKAAAEPSASARTVLAMAAACLRGGGVSGGTAAAFGMVVGVSDGRRRRIGCSFQGEPLSACSVLQKAARQASGIFVCIRLHGCDC